MSGRQAIIERARKMRVEIDGYFRDCDHWNKNVRKPGEPPINPDPDGELCAVSKRMDAIIAGEPQA